MNKKYQLKLNMNEEKNKYYAAFSYFSIRPLFKAQLLEYFDFDIIRAFNASKDDLTDVCRHYEVSLPRDYFEKKSKLNPDECFKSALSDENVKIVTIEDEKYPPLLKEIPDFPLSLYYKGNIDEINYDFNLAVVGSRNASENAKLALDNLISQFKNSNITIVSGLAYGIDAQAHKSAIENNLKTIAVIGSGLDITYPAANKPLYEKISKDKGVIFSEYPLKTRPAAPNFPQRNRIVTGMSKGTLVAEAQLKSGAMISANLTLDYNRELMCIPGNILNPNTTGIYHLIKNGAGIVVNADDLLNQMNWDIILKEEKTSVALNDVQQKIINTLALDSKTFDEIMENIKGSVSEIMIALTELELKGLIKQSNNKYYKCK